MTQHRLRGSRTSRTTIQRLTLFILSLALFSGLGRGQTSSPTPPPLAGIAHVAVRVQNLDAAREFYEKLGFEEAFSLSKDGVVYESFIKINDRQFLELYPVSATDTKVGFLHLCFEGADLEAINEDYRSRGLTPKPVRKAGAGNLLFTMVGPEDQNIEYTQYMPGSLHSNDQGKHLGEDRIADKLVSVSLAMHDPMAARDFYINQLNFKPIAGDQMVLHMPGASGQEVQIAASSLGAKARFALQTENLNKAARHLHKEQIPTLKSNSGLSITDPDGNIVLIEPH